MDKMDMVTPFSYHVGKVIVSAYTQRSGTEGKAIIGTVVVPDNPFVMVCGTDYPRKSEYRKRRVIGMNGHGNAAFFRYRYNGIQKQGEVLGEYPLIDPLISIQYFLKSQERITFFRTWQTCDDGIGEFLLVLIGQGFKVFRSTFLDMFGIGEFRSGSF